MRLPKIGDKIYIVSCCRNVCRIGEIKRIVEEDAVIRFCVDWILNPSPDGNELCYYYRFKTWPVTIHLDSGVFITFDEQEFTRLLKENLCLKE